MNASKRYKDIDMPYTCPETGRIFEHARGLSIYITKTLKISQSDYYDKYINHKDNSCFFYFSTINIKSLHILKINLLK